jgi:hypothetical protein
VDQARRHRQTELNLGKSGGAAKPKIEKLLTNPAGAGTPGYPYGQLRDVSFYYQLDFLCPGGGKRIEVRAAVIQRRLDFAWSGCVIIPLARSVPFEVNDDLLAGQLGRFHV